MIKKIIAYTLILMFLLNINVFSMEEKTYSKLENFGIIKSNELKDGDVTRGMLAKYSIRLSGFNEECFVSKIPFKDVSADDENYKYITAAYSLGYMLGTSDKTFSPNEKITGMQALKVVLSVLGYSKYAECNGGYPSGYVKVGVDTQLSKGLDLNNTMTAEQFVNLLYKATRTDVLEISSIKNNSLIYRNSDEDLLSEYYEIYHHKGILKANRYTSLYSADSELGNNKVNIDNKIYILDNFTSLPYLGHKVEIFYKETDFGNEIVYIDYKSEELTINARDITDFKNGMLFYEVNGKVNKTKIPNDAKIIVNNKLSDFVLPSKGNIVLIDNNDDGTTEVVKIYDYKTMFVDYIGTEKIMDGTTDEVIDLDSDECDYFVKKENNISSVKNINLNNVLLYSESYGEGYNIKEILISDKVVEGKVSEVFDDKVLIGKNEYYISDFVKTNVYLGLEGKFYLDCYGEICSYDGIKYKVFGYLNKIYKGPFDEVKVKIFTENDRWVILKLKNKVKYNRNTCTAKEAYNILTSADDFRQLIEYRVNTDGLIYEINTAQTFEKMSDEENIAIKNKTFRLSYENASVTYRGADTFDASVLVNDSTKIFRVPAQEKGSWADEEEFQIIKKSWLVDSKTYNVKAYNLDNVFNAEVCVITGGKAFINTTVNFAKFLIVDKICNAINEDGEETYMIVGYYGGTEFSVCTKSKEILDSITPLEKGDVIQVLINKNGYVTEINPIYESKNGAEQKILIGTIYGAPTIFGGKISYSDSITMKAVVEYKTDAFASVNLSNLKTVYIYDVNKGCLKFGTLDDITEGDYILSIMRYLMVRELIIFRK